MIMRDVWIRIIKDFKEFELPKIIEREKTIKTEIPIKRVISIIGPRRVGKTYFMFQQIRKLLDDGVEKERILYVNFESDLLIGATVDDLRNMMEIFYEIYPENKKKKVYLFFDEIQNIPGWERFVRSIMDSENVQIFVSGSSSKLLSKEVATMMRGRSLPYYIFPFSFKEFLKAKEFKLGKYLSSSQKAKLMNLLTEYVNFGGYPEAVLYPEEREKILREILDVTIYRDITERFGIKNIKLVKLLFRHLTSSTFFSVHSFFNYIKSFGMKVSKNTLYNYSEYFSDALVVIFLRKFSKSYKEIEQTKPKIYFIDNGLLYINGVESKSKLMENLVLVEIVKKGFLPNENIFYYQKNNHEVDFIIIEKMKAKKLIQVCYDLSDIETKKREIKSLVNAMKEFGLKEGLIITMDFEGEEKVDGKKIIYVPLWKWLISSNEF
ncbi:MAG: ATP-binding protein [Candidatus Aenigmatarchaeota archaeon]